MAFTVKVDFGSGLENITAHCEALEKTQSLHKRMRPTINTCRFKVSDKTTANKFNTATVEMDLEVQESAVDWFVGIIRPTFKNQINAGLRAFSVEGYDKGILLQKRIDQNLTWLGYKVCDTASKSTSILHQLFYEAGIIDAELSLTTINKTIPSYSVEAESRKTYKSEIHDLLFEFGYTYDVGDDGVFVLQDLYPTSLPAGTAIDDSKIFHGMTISKREVQYEAVKVRYHALIWLRNVTLYANYKNGDAWKKCSILIGSGATWPGGTVEFRVQGYDELYRAANCRLIWKGQNGIYIQTETYYDRRASVQFGNRHYFPKRILQFDIKGDAQVRDKNNYDYSTHEVVASTEKIQEVTTRFLSAKVDADRLASGLAKYYDFADFMYSFETEEAIDVGDYLDLTEAVMSITTDLRVVEVKEDELGHRRLLCEGVSDYTVGSIDEDHTTIYPPIIEIVDGHLEQFRDRMDALAGLEEENVHWNDDSADTEVALLELSSPDCVSNESLVPSDKLVHFEPAEYADERDFKYRNPHTKLWNGLSAAIFKGSTNLIESPENLTVDWTNTNSTDHLTDRYVNGYRLTIVQATAAAGYVYQDIAFTGDAVKSLILIARQGDDTVTRIHLRDTIAGAYRLEVLITWATQAVTIENSNGTIQHENWIDTTTVQLGLITGTVTAANTNQLRLLIPTNGKYSLFTAVQAEDSIYSTPYIPLYRYPTKTRPVSVPIYETTLQSKLVFKIKIRPWFVYDTSIDHRIVEWYIDATHRFYLFYDASSDKFRLAWQDGGTERILESQQFDDGTSYDDINSEIILFGSIDLTTGDTTGSRLFAIVNEVKQTEDIAWSGNIDAKSSTFFTLSIGHEGESIQIDSLTEYIKIWDWDGVSLGAIADEEEFDAATEGLTERFDWTLEDFDDKYQPLSKRGSVGIFKTTENLVTDPEDLTGWTQSGTCAVALSSFYLGGKRFTKLTSTTNAAHRYQAVVFTGNGVKSASVILKKGSEETDTQCDVRDTSAPASRLAMRVNWTTRTVTAPTGTLRKVNWLAKDMVEISAFSTSVTAANDHRFRVFPSVAGQGNVYATACMTENSGFPTPYTPTNREDQLLTYAKPMPSVFTLMFWCRSVYLWNDNGAYTLLCWYPDIDSLFWIYYNTTFDKFYVHWRDGGTMRTLQSQQFDDGGSYENFDAWIHIAVQVDLTTGTTAGSALWINGVKVDDTWDGAIDAKTSNFLELFVGHNDGIQQANAFITDLLFHPALLADSVIQDHYLKNRPWYEPSEIANPERTVRIDKSGIKLHNTSLVITDVHNRLIDISNQAGLLARDAAGNLIHDIPDSPTQKGNDWMGHLLWYDGSETSYTLYNNASAPRGAWNSLICVLDNNTNVKGGIFKVRLYGAGTGTTLPLAMLYLRPKGSGWAASSALPIPLLLCEMDLTGATVVAFKFASMMICPIGDDNSIDWYFNITPNSVTSQLTITQMGLWV